MKQNSKYYNMLLCFGIYSCGGLSVLVGPIIYNLSQIYPDVPMTTIRLATLYPRWFPLSAGFSLHRHWANGCLTRLPCSLAAL